VNLYYGVDGIVVTPRVPQVELVTA
jgi:hypothetical protein